MAIFQNQGPKSFGGGEALSSLAAGINDETQQRLKNKLQLAMESARIQQESQARMQEAIQTHQLNQVEPGTLGPVLESVRNGGALPPNMGPIPTGIAQAAVSGAGMSNRIPVNMISSEDANGNKIVTPFKQGKQIGGGTSVGFSTGAASKISAAKTAFNSGTGFVSELKKTVGGFLGATDASQLPAQYAKLRLNQILQNNPDAKAYFDGLTARALTAEKDMTGTAREASSIISGFAKSLPQMSDTAPTALAKINQLEERVNRGATAAAKTYKISPEEFMGTQAATGTSRDEVRKALGL